MGRKPDHDRDVATTVLTASTAAERTALTHLAADARMLTINTHPSVVPVVEARWLAANRLSITRSRVQGSTLREALDAVGPMPEPRVVEVLTDVGAVLEWASRAGVVHRQVSSDTVFFQKGKGRTMVSFGLPPALDGDRAISATETPFLFERCADGATLALLAYEMLTAHRPGDASLDSLRTVRRDTTPQMLAAVEAGLACTTGGPALTARQFLALLTGAGTTVSGAAVVPAVVPAPVVPRSVPTPLRTAPPAAAGPAPAVVPVAPLRPTTVAPAASGPMAAGPPPRRRRGRGLLIASMLALVVLVGSTFALIQRDRSGADEPRAAATAPDGEAAGDVAVAEPEPLPPDPEGLTTGDPLPRVQDPAMQPMPGQPPAPGTLPPSLPSNLPAPLPEALPPASRPAPVPAEPPAESPAEPPIPRPAPSVATGEGCSSPALDDQRECLNGLIRSSDAELTSVYQALLREIGERDGESAVESIRADQRAWLGARDRACRNPAARDGTLWARERAACLARQSDARALELARALAAVRNSRP